MGSSGEKQNEWIPPKAAGANPPNLPDETLQSTEYCESQQAWKHDYFCLEYTRHFIGFPSIVFAGCDVVECGQRGDK